MARTPTPGGRVKLRRKKLRDGRVSLYLDTYDGGERSYEFLKLYLTGNRTADAETLRIAETHRTRRELALVSAEYDVPLTTATQGDGDFFEFVEAIVKRRGTKHWKNLLHHLREFTGGKLPMRQVTRLWVRDFRAYLLGAVHQNSAFVYFGRLRAAIREARDEGALRGDPLERVEPIKLVETEVSFLTIEELRKLAATPIQNQNVRRAFLFGCYTGLRFSDVAGLTWGQLQGKRITLRQQKTKGVEYLTLSDQALELMGKRGSADEAIFPLPAHATVWSAIRRWAKRAELGKKVGFHTSRHTFATLALTYDADLYTVSKLLGHKNIRVTQRYAKVIDRKKEEAVAKLPRL